MKVGAIDEYSSLSSPFHRWDPRYKLVGFLTLIFAFSFVRDLRLLLAVVTVTVGIYLVSRLPASYLVRRLRYPSLFLLALVLILPFVSGQTVVASLGPLAVRQEGLIGSLLIATRFLAILTVGSVLFGTAPFLTTIRAMRALRLPGLLADMVLLSFRYLHEIGNDLQKMQTAMKLRGFGGRSVALRNIRILAWLAGSILVRSYERAEWVYKAMIVRGYGHAPDYRGYFHARASDVAILVVLLLTAASLVAGQIISGHA